MFSIFVDYPSRAEEMEIVRSTTSAYVPDLARVLSAQEIAGLQELVRRVPVADEVIGYAVKLAGATRPADGGSPKFIRDWVSWGAGPRASQYLILGAKTRAMLDGRYTPMVDDVKAVARPVLRHRIVTNFTAEAESVRPDAIVQRLVEET
jgi:MoxR-like ATPase